MLYDRSQEIEKRFSEVLRLIQDGCLSTRMLADELGVSVPTVSRLISALRKRGHQIEAVKDGRNWSYKLMASQHPKPKKTRR
jgi:biotin operon repressor